MGLEIQGAVNSMLNSATQIKHGNDAVKRSAVNIALGAVKGFAMGGPAGAIAGGVTAAAKEEGINASGAQTLGAAAQGASSGQGAMEGIKQEYIQVNPAEEAKAKAIEHMRQAQEQKQIGRKDIVNAYNNLSGKDKRWTAYDIQKLRGGK